MYGYNIRDNIISGLSSGDGTTAAMAAPLFTAEINNSLVIDL